MRIGNFTTVRPEMSDTRTRQSLMKFLGDRPERLGIMSNLYQQYTATHLTESLMNVYTMEDGKANAFQSVNSFLVEWDLAIHRIKRVAMVAVPEGDGSGGSDVVFKFGERYYEKFDTFIVEKTRQQFIVLSRPQRIRDNEFVYVCKIQDDSYNSVVDLSGCYVGAETRFITNYQPELSEEGYSKYMSNTEKHRTYISYHRTDVDFSAQYAALEDVYIQIGKGDKSDPVYEMNSAEKDCLNSFMQARNQHALWGKTNMDKDGKAKIYDPETGQPVIAGDGIIAQIERFATKFVFSKLSIKYFQKALAEMITKSENPTGNNYMFIVNTMMWNEIQDVLQTWIMAAKTAGTFLYSKASNGYIDLGNTYNSFEFGGNVITFKVDRSFNIEYPNRKFGIFLDLTSDSASGKPALNMFTLKGKEFIHNVLTGAGFSSGAVSSAVTAKKLINTGYCGVAVYNPYRAVIMISEEVSRY